MIEVLMLLTIFIWIVGGYLGARIFARKGYSPILGAFIGVGLGFLPFRILLVPLGLLMMLLIPSTTRAEQLSNWDRKLTDDVDADRPTRICPKCGRVNSIATRICPRCEERLIIAAK